MVYAASLPGDRNVRVRQVVAAEYVLNQYEGTTMTKIIEYYEFLLNEWQFLVNRQASEEESKSLWQEAELWCEIDAEVKA
jgi:hypothetical protein